MFRLDEEIFKATDPSSGGAYRFGGADEGEYGKFKTCGRYI